MHKRIHPSKWTVTASHKDIQSLVLRYEDGSQEKKLAIHNVYNLSPSSYSATEEGTLNTLCNQLQQEVNSHIVIKDFNLHHSMWAGISRSTQHKSADILIDIAQNALLELATPQRTITWAARGLNSTIDLAFLSQHLATRVIHCRPRLDINQSSDHFPIETSIQLRTQQVIAERRRNWKSMDDKALLESLENSGVPTQEITSRHELDARISKLTQAVTKAIDHSTPWSRLSEQAQEYWSPEYSDAVKETQRTYYDLLHENTSEAEELHREARRKKVNIIRKHKSVSFRNKIKEVASTKEGAWRLAKWVRKRTGASREPLQLPQIVTRRNGETRTITELPEKLEALRDKFFPPPQSADLEDLKETNFPEPIQAVTTIHGNDVSRAIMRVARDKAPGPDGIPNRILKAAEK